MPSFPLSVCALEQREQALSLGARLALDAQLGVDLVDILPDAALGEEQLFGDLPVAQALGRQLGQGVFPVRQGGQGRRTGCLPPQLLPPGLPRFPQTDDLPDQGLLLRPGRDRW